MRFTIRLVAFALWSCGFLALPSHASQESSAHLVGVKCQLPTNQYADSENPSPDSQVCQIVDDGGPILTFSPSCLTNGSCLATELLLHALFTLDDTPRNASAPHHPTALPPPTP
jgi:hypothetical protein